MSADSQELWVAHVGLVPYEEAVSLQKRLEQDRHADEIPDVLLLLEHPPVYTKGRRTRPADLPMGEDWYRMQGIEVCETDRGGQVTYHGPGQLVAYPIIQLPAGSSASRPGPSGSGPARVDVVEYVRRLEQVMIGALGDFGVSAQVFDGLTGVWTGGEPPIAAGEVGPQRTPVGSAALPGGEARKIGSIGIHVNRGVTTHGLAVNVNNDLQPFEWVVPCAIEGVRMTSLARELGAEQDLAAFANTIRDRFAEVFGMRATEIDGATLEPATA